MQSFRHSRWKILFEISCAFAVSASCVGAWMQTGAGALLLVSFVAALYGLGHAFELKTVRPVTTVDSHGAGPAIGSQDLFVFDEEAESPVTATDPESMVEATVEKAPPAKQSQARTRGKNRRRAKGTKEPKAAELAPQAQSEVDGPTPLAENAQFPLVPLFEPQPYMRQQRAVFGRKDNFG